MNTISWEEVSTHNRNTDCWIVVDGFVYDITNWIDKHPGGSSLAVLAGEDASAMVHSSHLHDISKHLERYKIGKVSNYKPDFIQYSDDFLIELKKRVASYFNDNKVDYRKTHKNNLNIILTSFFWLACWYCLYFLPPLGLLAAVPMGLATCSLIGSFGHERIHGNLFSHLKNTGIIYRLINNTLWGVFIPFMPERYFQYEHIKHHNYPMNPEQDYDVYALKSFVRLSPDSPHKKHHTFQHIYAPFVYGAYIFIQVVMGYISPFFDNRELLKDKNVIADIIMSNLVAMSVHIIIPIYLTGFWWAALCSSIFFFTWQTAIYISSGVPHMTTLYKENKKNWSYYICKTTRNLKCDSPFFNWLTGGLNHHLSHHLLPSIPHEHLLQITPIVKQTCEDFNYPFYSYNSFSTYYSDHYRFLQTLGKAY